MFCSCKSGGSSDEDADSLAMAQQEDKAAKQRLQGIWLNAESQNPVFMVADDSIFYPDTVNLPVRFAIVGDSLVLKGDETVKYKIIKQGDYTFSFLSDSGETIKLHKSDNPEDSVYFTALHIQPVVYNQVTKRDTIVTHAGQRYHCYVFVNPSRTKVYKTSYNEEGMNVENYYYDNIIHLSVYKGSAKLLSRDFNKRDFNQLIPNNFLKQATLSDVKFRFVDDEGFHFDATLCIPDEALCYMVQVLVKMDGTYKLTLMDY